MFIVVVLLLLPGHAVAVKKNGFDLSDAAVPASEIQRGGPSRDGIFALTNPDFVAADRGKLRDDSRILGVVFNGIAKAYPLRMLTIHEIVNDTIDDQFYSITYCPLCGSGVAFATNLGTGHLNFGVSGLLYNSDMLLYDRNTESLWSQLTGSAIAGRLKGTKLPLMPVWHTSWKGWREQHPESLVMRGDRRFRDAYRQIPYPGYAKTSRLYYPVEHEAPSTYHTKELVLGLIVGGVAKAYPFVELERHGLARFTDLVGDTEITLLWDADEQSAHAQTGGGKPFPTTTLYWFAWFTFHPDTEVFTAVSAE